MKFPGEFSRGLLGEISVWIFGSISDEFRVSFGWISVKLELISGEIRVNFGWVSGEFSVRDWFVGFIETKNFNDQSPTAKSIWNKSVH